MKLELPPIIEKVRKLLALSTDNPSKEEGIVALKKAQELMISHGLSFENIKSGQLPVKQEVPKEEPKQEPKQESKQENSFFKDLELNRNIAASEASKKFHENLKGYEERRKIAERIWQAEYLKYRAYRFKEKRVEEYIKEIDEMNKKEKNG